MKPENMTPEELNELHPAALAHVGDAVFELYVRETLCRKGPAKVNDLHKATIQAVCAPAQAEAFRILEPMLTEDELAVYKRARNTHHARIPHGATPGEYAAATGLEALFGWLYLSGNTARCDELFDALRDRILTKQTEEAK